MQEWGVENKKRRQEQIRLIRQGSHKMNQPENDQIDSYSDIRKPVALLSTQDIEPPNWVSPPPPLREIDSLEPIQAWERPKPWKKQTEGNKPAKFLIQMLIAATLFFGTTIAVQYQTQLGQMITGGLQQKMDISMVVKIVDQVLGDHVTVLPAFVGTIQEKKNQPALSASWQMPTKGDIYLPFTTERKGMVLRLTNDAEVQVVRDGWVAFVGNKEGLGNTVIVEHEDGSESWYGFLIKPSIKAKEVVKKGDVLGKTAEKHGQHFLYFAIHKQNTWLDPTKVISFGASN